MIYKFNEYKSEKREPKQVAYPEFYKIRRFGSDKFTTYERKRIKEISKIKYKTKFDISSSWLEVFPTYGKNLFICKYQDEWFTIQTEDQAIRGPRGGGDSIYYICDGFEELESFLNNLYT